MSKFFCHPVDCQLWFDLVGTGMDWFWLMSVFKDCACFGLCLNSVVVPNKFSCVQSLSTSIFHVVHVPRCCMIIYCSPTYADVPPSPSTRGCSVNVSSTGTKNYTSRTTQEEASLWSPLRAMELAPTASGNSDLHV